jgi:hypothetical protein
MPASAAGKRDATGERQRLPCQDGVALARTRDEAGQKGMRNAFCLTTHILRARRTVAIFARTAHGGNLCLTKLECETAGSEVYWKGTTAENSDFTGKLRQPNSAA